MKMALSQLSQLHCSKEQQQVDSSKVSPQPCFSDSSLLLRSLIPMSHTYLSTAEASSQPRLCFPTMRAVSRIFHRTCASVALHVVELMATNPGKRFDNRRHVGGEKTVIPVVAPDMSAGGPRYLRARRPCIILTTTRHTVGWRDGAYAGALVRSDGSNGAATRTVF